MPGALDAGAVTRTTQDRSGRVWATPLREVTRALSWHRRLVAGVLAGVAVLAALQALRPAAVRAVPVVAASGDLPAGLVLTPGDLRLARLPPGLVPAGSSRSVAAVVGARLAAPVRSGEPVTDVRLVGPDLLAAYRHTVGADVGEVLLPLADTATVALLRPGDSLDVLAAPTAGPAAGGPAITVARDVPVLAVAGGPAGGADGPGAGAGSALTASAGTAGAVLLAVTPATAQLLAQAAVSSAISVLVHPG